MGTMQLDLLKKKLKENVRKWTAEYVKLETENTIKGLKDVV